MVRFSLRKRLKLQRLGQKPQDKSSSSFFRWGTPPPLYLLGRQNIIHVMKWTRPSPSIFTYCKRSKTGRWEGLETRLKGHHNSHMCIPYSGDFHFLWECLRSVFIMFWGSPAHIGSLCNLREYIQRTGVDKAVKVFNRGDEFLVHAFKSHLL